VRKTVPTAQKLPKVLEVNTIINSRLRGGAGDIKAGAGLANSAEAENEKKQGSNWGT